MYRLGERASKQRVCMWNWNLDSRLPLRYFISRLSSDVAMEYIRHLESYRKQDLAMSKCLSIRSKFNKSSGKRCVIVVNVVYIFDYVSDEESPNCGDYGFFFFFAFYQLFIQLCAKTYFNKLWPSGAGVSFGESCHK